MTRKQPDPNDSLLAHLHYLKCSFVLENYLDLAQQAGEQHWDHLAFLTHLLEGEVLRRQARSVERRVRLARFPVIKSLDQFDWSWPRKINRAHVLHLFRLNFVEQHANVIFVGGVGLGKSHLATALAMTACERGYSVLFTCAVDVVNTLAAAQRAGRLKVELRRYLRPRVLVLDELGYLPIDKTGADLLFQIISQRYEHGSTIITTNRIYKKWAPIFNNDATLTSAVLDRLLHHAETVRIEGPSFRMKDRLNETNDTTPADPGASKTTSETED